MRSIWYRSLCLLAIIVTPFRARGRRVERTNPVTSLFPHLAQVVQRSAVMVEMTKMPIRMERKDAFAARTSA